MKNKNLSTLIFCALMTACACVLSQIVIPTPFGVPLTLQTFIFALTGFVLGARFGISVSLLYIIMGAIGLPVFSGFRGGIGCIFGDLTGGFLIGFIPLTALCGIKQYVFHKKHGRLLSVAFGSLGVVLCHICGVSFYSAISGIPFLESTVIVSLPFILKDMIFVFLAYLLSGKIIKILKRS
jgi:biotin transport system substrate-specific component